MMRSDLRKSLCIKLEKEFFSQKAGDEEVKQGSSRGDGEEGRDSGAIKEVN